MMKTRMYTKMNLINLLLHLHKRTTTPKTMKEDKRKNKTMKRMFHPDPNKSSHELEQEFQVYLAMGRAGLGPGLKKPMAEN